MITGGKINLTKGKIMEDLKIQVPEILSQVVDSSKGPPTNTGICRHCRQEKNKEGGYTNDEGMSYEFFICSDCLKRAKEENARADETRRQEMIEKYISENIPRIYQHAKLSDIEPSILETIKDGFKKKHSLFLFGKCGSGKTHLGCAFAMDRMRLGKHFVNYINANELLLKIKGSFDSRGNDAEDIINRYSSGLAVIDDLGSFKITDYVIDVFYTIIDKRYRDDVGTDRKSVV